MLYSTRTQEHRTNTKEHRTKKLWITACLPYGSAKKFFIVEEAWNETPARRSRAHNFAIVDNQTDLQERLHSRRLILNKISVFYTFSQSPWFAKKGRS